MKRIVTLITFCIIAHFSTAFGQSRFVSWHSYTAQFELAPMASLGIHEFTHKDDTSLLYSPSIEAGAVLLVGNYDEWTSMGGFPLGAGWSYFGPYASMQYHFRDILNGPATTDRSSLYNGAAFNFGVTGGAGALLLILPATINGTLALHTDFNRTAIKLSVGMNAKRYAINLGNYINLSKAEPYQTSMFVELTATIWDKY